MHALAIIQSRVGSTRLPNKALAELCGIPLTTHVIRRVKAAKLVNRVCLVTPDTPENDVLAALATAEGVDVYRGSEDDLLARFFWAAEGYPNADTVCRLTADDPFKDPTLIDAALDDYAKIRASESEDAALIYYHLGGPSWPVGCDVEVFSRRALTTAYQMATLPEDREHVCSFMGRATHLFMRWQPKNPYLDRYPQYNGSARWTIDVQADLDYARFVYDRLYPADNLFGYRAIVEAGL